MFSVVEIIGALLFGIGVGAVAVVILLKVVSDRTRPKMSTMPTATKLFSTGTVLVTGTGEIVIDEVLPSNKAMLENPDVYITVEFDPTAPAPPPCAGGLLDECDWTLFFRHIHDTRLDTRVKLDPTHRVEELKLKIEWNVSSARTLIWTIRVPE